MAKIKKLTTLSELTTEEKNTIAKINRENLLCNGGTLTISNILFYFNEGDILILAYYHQDIVGYALIKKPINEGVNFMCSAAGHITDKELSWSTIVQNPNALYIAQIAVAKDYQRLGIATEILESMNDSVVVSNAKTINEISHKVHLKNGFRVIGGMYNYKQEPYDLLYYRDIV